MTPPPADVLAELSCKLDLTPDEALALVTDIDRAPAIMDDIIARFQLETDGDAEPWGLQLHLMGVLSESTAQFLDGVE